MTTCCPSVLFAIVDSPLIVLCWLPTLLFLRPNRFKLHRRRLLIRLGGMGGSGCTFIFGWVALYIGWWEDGGKDNCVNIWEDVDNVGNELDVGEADVAGLEKPDVAELDPEPLVWLVSGNGYSNRVSSFAKGVPTIWEDGEWRGKSARFIDLGFIAIIGELGMWSVVWSPMVSTTVAIDIESDISESSWGVESECCGRMNAWYKGKKKKKGNEENTHFRRLGRHDVRLHRVTNIGVTVDNKRIYDIWGSWRAHENNGYLGGREKSLRRGYVAWGQNLTTPGENRPQHVRTRYYATSWARFRIDSNLESTWTTPTSTLPTPEQNRDI